VKTLKEVLALPYATAADALSAAEQSEAHNGHADLMREAIDGATGA
jgi:hypothetical protein